MVVVKQYGNKHIGCSRVILTVTTSGNSHSDAFEVTDEAVVDPARVICSSRHVLLPLLGHSAVSWRLLPQRLHFLPLQEFL